MADLWGIPGSGKTALLKQAKTELATPADLVLHYGFSAEERKADDSDARAIADYGAFQGFAAWVGEELKEKLEPEPGSREERLLNDFDDGYDRAQLPIAPVEVKMAAIFGTIKDNEIGSGRTPEEVRASVDAKRPVLVAALGQLLRGLTQENPDTEPRRVLLGLDDFEWVPPGPLRTWILELVGKLDSALVLVPRMPEFAPPTVGHTAVSCPLDRLSREDISELVNECLPGREISDQLLDVIEHASDGHAQAASLAVELLQRYEDAEADAFAQKLDALPDDLAQKHTQMVEQILGRDGTKAEQILRACAVMRKFDASMLEAVAGAEADLDSLKRYSFVEPAPDPRDGFFRIHPVIRRELARRLEESDRDRFLDLHALAASHCADWISEFEEEEDMASESGSYASWYRYEDQSWQAAKREWLFHQAQASRRGKKERELGRRRFAGVFFDAFWWWGCYLDFPFCRVLIEDWRSTQEDREWTEALEVILEAYPSGYEKAGAPAEWRSGELPRWDAVRAALLSVLDECGIDGDAAALEEADARHVRGLIDNFLAHAARYRALDATAYATAIGHYDEAVRLFEQDKDNWDTAWTRFERGELHLEHGNADAARPDWQKAAELVVELEDEELAANLHRLAADTHAAAGDFDRAFAAHGRAVLHAYLFQRRPHPPDEYTLSFYGEQVARAIERLLGHAGDAGDAAHAAELLAGAFPGRQPPPPDEIRTLCEQKDLAGLSAALFPDPPLIEELNRRNSQFVQRWLLTEPELQLAAPTDLQASAW